jgi:hypothetical protein
VHDADPRRGSGCDAHVVLEARGSPVWLRRIGSARSFLGSYPDFRSSASREAHGCHFHPTSTCAFRHHHNNTRRGRPQLPPASRSRHAFCHPSSRAASLRCIDFDPNGRGAAPLPLGRARSPPHFYLRLRDFHGLDGLSPHLHGTAATRSSPRHSQSR